MIYHIFISHAWKYSDNYNQIVTWLNEAQAEGLLTWKNYSVPEHDPIIDPDTQIGKNTLKEELTKQISPASKVIVLAGMYASYSDWINFEINIATSQNKYIIGVKPWGQERIPTVISNNANIMVGWNKKSIIDAIINS